MSAVPKAQGGTTSYCPAGTARTLHAGASKRGGPKPVGQVGRGYSASLTQVKKSHPPDFLGRKRMRNPRPGGLPDCPTKVTVRDAGNDA